MARPLNKTQLLDVSKKQYDKLVTYLATLTADQMKTPRAPQSSIKDIIGHLYEWQQMFFIWYETGLRGEKPAVPATGFKWSQLPEVNQNIYEKYEKLPLDDIFDRFKASHSKTVQFIESLSDLELTTPGLYPWMNRNTLLAYLNSITGSHYLWALKEIKKSLISK